MPNQNKISAMRSENLQQTPAGLLVLAKSMRYKDDELVLLGKVIFVAIRLCNGIYRPCGRPFVNHLIGTASVLIYFGFELKLVLVGLLHAAYSHKGISNNFSPTAHLSWVSNLLCDIDPNLELAVRAYTTRSGRYLFLNSFEGGVDGLLMSDIELLLLESANLIDMYLSWEVEVTGRSDIPENNIYELMLLCCGRLSPAMGQTLQEIKHMKHSQLRVSYHTQMSSFRLAENSTESAIIHNPFKLN
jgi:hypothetical protein